MMGKLTDPVDPAKITSMLKDTIDQFKSKDVSYEKIRFKRSYLNFQHNELLRQKDIEATRLSTKKRICFINKFTQLTNLQDEKNRYSAIMPKINRDLQMAKDKIESRINEIQANLGDDLESIRSTYEEKLELQKELMSQVQSLEEDEKRYYKIRSEYQLYLECESLKNEYQELVNTAEKLSKQIQNKTDEEIKSSTSRIGIKPKGIRR